MSYILTHQFTLLCRFIYLSNTSTKRSQNYTFIYLLYLCMCLQVSEGAVLELMEQDSKDSAQSSSTSTSIIDTASQPEYKVKTPLHTLNKCGSIYLSSLRPCTNNPRLPAFVHPPLTCNSSLAKRLCLNAEITAFVIVAYPLVCESQSRAPGSSVHTDDRDKEAEWGFCGLGRLAKSMLTTDT